MVDLRKVVPWHFLNTDSHGLWTWTTPAFLAVICKHEGAFTWEVSSDAVVLGSGGAEAFPEAESRTLEVVAKAFHDQPDYTKYTGGAGGHYILADGQRHNLTNLDRRQVRLQLEDGSTVEGQLRVGEWALHLQTPSDELDVQPHFVTQIDQL